jgi:predicted transcriptional regulator
MLLSLPKTMDEKTHNLIPNSSQIPNVILDLVLPRISEAEARCLLYICRRTFGFHKDEDNISFSQFEHGIKTSQGRRLDYGTGLSRPSVNTALQNLIKVGVIFVQQRSRGNRYKLNLHMDVDKVVNEINQLRELTRSGKSSLPKVVKQVNTQNLGKKEKPSIRDPVNNLSTEMRKLTEKMTINRFNH